MFLLAIPRSRETPPSDCSVTIDPLFNNIERTYRSILRGLKGHISTVHRLGKSKGPFCLQFTKSGDAHNFSYVNGNWSVAAGYDCASKLVASVHRVAGRVTYEDPVWGCYAAARGNVYTGRITAWNTVPTIEAIYYSQTPVFTYVSNRPLLIALALAGGGREAVELNRNFITEYLLYGYSITSQTPYTDVFILESHRALEIHNGEIDFAEYPLGLEGKLKFDHTVTDAGEELKASMQSAMGRVEEQVHGSQIQLRMSGGKDSRLLLSLLRQSKMDVYGITFGRPEDDEVLISKYLTDAAGIHLSAQSSPVAPGETIRDKVEEVLRQCDGVPLSEPHASIYAGANPRNPGDGIMLGQWPLMKGGAARKMRYTTEQIQSVVESQAVDIVQDQHRAPYDRFLLTWLNSRSSSSELEKLYLLSRDFRSSRWMLALTCMYDRDSKVVYPLADNEVTAVADSMSMGEKISESAYFKALKSLWPLATSVPTVDSNWPFETSGPNSKLDPENYNSRNMLPSSFIQEQKVTPPEGTFLDRTLEFSSLVVRTISEEILVSPASGLFMSIVEPEFWEIIQKYAEGKSPTFRNLSSRTTKQCIWRVYVANVWYAKSWLHAT